MIIEMSQTEGYEIFLQHVQFETTGRCNMSCLHCRAWNEPKQDLPLSVMESILGFVAAESDHGFGVTISGGEPFMRKDLAELIRVTASFPVKLVAITTNGSLCSGKRLKEVLSSKGETNIIIQVSLDSADAKEHNEFRGYPGAYDSALDGLKCAQDIGLQTAIRATIREGHVDAMEPLVQLAHSLSIPNISFGTVVPFGRATNNSMGMTALQKKEFLLEVVRLKRHFQDLINVETEDPLKFIVGRGVWDFSDIDPNDDLSFGGCTAGITTINVTSDGIVTPCAVLPTQILDAKNKSSVAIAEEFVRSSVVKTLLSRSLGGKCASCEMKRVCGGCRAVSFARSGDLMGEDCTCWC